MNIFHYEKHELAKKAGEEFSKKLLLNKNARKLLLLSGGSSMSDLNHVDTSLIDEEPTIAMSDDRYSTDPQVNNFLLLTQTSFYTKAKEQGAHFIETSVKNNESLEEVAARFETSIQNWKKLGGEIIATMGMGPDGHTCGMMPFPEDPEKFEELFENKNLVVGYDAKNKNEFPLRVTVTTPLVLQISHAIMYVQGDNKEEALVRVFDDEGTLPETPARIWREMNDVTIFTDIPF